MIIKSPILKHRVRKIPKSFSWVDHRLVKDKFIDVCSHAQASLYLFLVCVADAQGLSYYSDKSVMARLSMNYETLKMSRSGLIKASLIAWKEPIYQVLNLEPEYKVRHTGSAMNLKEILETAREVSLD